MIDTALLYGNQEAVGRALAATDGLTGCNSFDRVLNLVGNVSEWTSDCDSNGCNVRGGSLEDTGSTCATSAAQAFADQEEGIGVRCCQQR